MKILVTGGAGYVGSVLVQHAVKRGYSVNVLDQISSPPMSSESFTLYCGGLQERALVERSIKGVSAVIHLAGVSDGRAGKRDPDLTRRSNVDALGQLLRCCVDAGVERFIFASTMGVYGNHYVCPLTEELPLAPVDPYSNSKATGEELINSFTSSSFSPVALRIAMVYGAAPAMRYDFLVNAMTRQALQEKELTILGGRQKRPQTYIKDLANIFLNFLERAANEFAGEAFNVVGINPSLEEIATTVASTVGGVNISRKPPRGIEDNFEMDGSKLRRFLDYQQQDSLVEGIQSIIDLDQAGSRELGKERSHI